MALRNPNEKISDVERAFIARRFPTAQDGYIPDDLEKRKELQLEVRAEIYTLAKGLNESVEYCAELDMAITKLEEALLWAGKAMFKD